MSQDDLQPTTTGAGGITVGAGGVTTVGSGGGVTGGGTTTTTGGITTGLVGSLGHPTRNNPNNKDSFFTYAPLILIT